MSKESDGQDLIEAFFNALRMRHLHRCQRLLRSLEMLSRQQPTLKPWCTYMKGILAFEVDHNWAKAQQIFAELLQTDLEPALRGRVLYALGRSLDVQGRWQEAIAVFEQSLSISMELEQTIEQAKALKHIAISYRKGFTQGDFGPAALQRAVEYYQLALDGLEPITDPPPDVAWLKGSVWNGLGLACRDLGQWDQAIACYEQDLAICRSLGDRFGMGLSYGNSGEIYQKRGNWPEALMAYQQALSLIREFDNRYEETEALANLGFLHQEMGKYEPALDYYSQAIDLIEDLRTGITSEAARAGFFATIVDTYANTVLLCLAAGHEAQAFDYVERARSRAFLDVLAAGSPDLPRKMEATTITLAEVQAALPDDALLLEYFTTGLVEARDGRTSTGQTPQRHRFPPARTLIFAVTHDGIQVHDADLSGTALSGAQDPAHALRPAHRPGWKAPPRPASVVPGAPWSAALHPLSGAHRCRWRDPVAQERSAVGLCPQRHHPLPLWAGRAWPCKVLSDPGLEHSTVFDETPYAWLCTEALSGSGLQRPGREEATICRRGGAQRRPADRRPGSGRAIAQERHALSSGCQLSGASLLLPRRIQSGGAPGFCSVHCPK
jgi:tetratricopeptide (TPR) repeat protein